MIILLVLLLVIFAHISPWWLLAAVVYELLTW